MIGNQRQVWVAGLSLLVLAAVAACGGTRAAVTMPDPAVDESLAPAAGERTAVLAGGCFWGVQAVFEHVKGVKRATAGYSGGAANTADYETVSDGASGHAESVQIVYDPSQITYGQLLKVYFSVAHDPIELNRQGPDSGTQYRSAIFYASSEQQKIAQAYITQINAAKVFPGPIVTEVTPLKAFYAAEAYHQDYAAKNPSNLYIVVNDLPNVEQLKKEFPSLYRAR
jgi:peptide-methionine (S)-S-oxide reductase